MNGASLYPHLPIPLQNAVCWAYGQREARVRYGRAFERHLESLLVSERMSRAEQRAYQDAAVERVVRHAYDQVPYYRQLMDKLSLRPSDIRTAEDLKKLPVLTKEQVRQNFASLRARDAKPGELVEKHTSGSTGKSLTFIVTRDVIAFQWALAWRHRHRFGLEYGALHANFTGKLAVPPEQRKPPFWRWCTPLHQAFLNLHHLTPDKIGAVVRFLGEHPFEFYSGYPSILHVLSETALSVGAVLAHRPRVVSLAAENTYAYQADAIRRFTGAVVTDLYGMSEACGNASKCAEGVYHEDFEFGLLECGEPESLPGGRTRGKLLCTSFANSAFPLIRYEVGDAALWESEDQPCACGRQSRVLVHIEGRTDDYLLTPEGKQIMRVDYIFKGTDSVKECQIVQRVPGEIVIRLVPRATYGTADEERIRGEVARWISPRLEVRFEHVAEIERGPNGKFKALRSELRRSQT